MKTRRMILNLGGAVGGALAVVVSPALSQMTATQSTTTTAVKKKPTTATPQMIDEAIQRSQARAAKARAAGTTETFGSEEPFTYVPGKVYN